MATMSLPALGLGSIFKRYTVIHAYGRTLVSFDQKDVDVKGQNFELIPFSSGRRTCPGVSFGIQILQLALANLLHWFEFATSSDEAVDMREAAGLTSSKATPLEVHITPRLPLLLYECIS
ncbi:hypothetical protein DITRI_Ditri17bG0096000 [Diplodiscus trichospermus]